MHSPRQTKSTSQHQMIRLVSNIAASHEASCDSIDKDHCTARLDTQFTQRHTLRSEAEPPRHDTTRHHTTPHHTTPHNTTQRHNTTQHNTTNDDDDDDDDDDTVCKLFGRSMRCHSVVSLFVGRRWSLVVGLQKLCYRRLSFVFRRLSSQSVLSSCLSLCRSSVFVFWSVSALIDRSIVRVFVVRPSVRASVRSSVR